MVDYNRRVCRSPEIRLMPVESNLNNDSDISHFIVGVESAQILNFTTAVLSFNPVTHVANEENHSRYSLP